MYIGSRFSGNSGVNIWFGIRGVQRFGVQLYGTKCNSIGKTVCVHNRIGDKFEVVSCRIDVYTIL